MDLDEENWPPSYDEGGNWSFRGNSSNDTADPITDDTFTTVSLVCIGIFLSFMIMASIVGNALVCIAVATERSLRRIGNLFIVSLAIADMFVACLVMTFAGVNDLLGYWVFGEQFCDTWIAFDVMCSTASILNLAAISLDRYVHIKDPLRYGRWVNKRSILGVIAVVWILAALISFVPISLDLHRADELEMPKDPLALPTCALDLSPTYAVVSSCVSFYLPCFIMVGIYCRLYLYARKHVKNIKAVTRPPPRAGDATARTTPTHANSSYQVSDHKAAVTVGVIMGTFLVCWVPFFCANIVYAFCKTCIPDLAFKILTWLGYSNSCFNPVIYSIFNTEFRAAFRRILTSRLPPCCKDLGWCPSCRLISCCRRCGYQAVALIQRRRSDPEVGSLHQMNGICTFRETPRSSGGSIPGTNTRSTTPREIRCGSGSGVTMFGEKVSAI
ncbi:dopamine receptor 1 [Folsomia candida]|uniref:dopamine receptor 1 n=1 Tax=Folsomia candida TaxID=158441 RepID=UPI00160534EA|nr:dopamine receptor 1 [Folsomia candida]